MGLAEYKRKRNFEQTPEPAGKVAKPAARGQFVVQKHAASRLHYDLRLELAGTLKSWAVPKGPSLDPSVKSLAVEVEDHPLDYADFEGVIPQGQYGGGTVMVWDRGEWTPEADAAAGLKQGKLNFQLKGSKLKGGWTLVRMGGPAGKGGKNWLLIKRDDQAARPADEFNLVEKRPKSVATKRTMEEIAAQSDRVWSSNNGDSKNETAAQRTTLKSRIAAAAKASSSKTKTVKKRPVKKATRTKRSPKKANRMPDPSGLTGARQARQPATLKPQLATLGSAAPTGDLWVHELKFDGYRMLAIFKKGKVRLLTRRGNDWTHRFGAVVDALEDLGIDEAILDGEIVSLDAHGISNFQQLQNQLKRGDDSTLAYYLFDAPHFAGYDLTATPLVERKALLEKLLTAPGKRAATTLRYSEHLKEDGDQVWQHACRSGLEGIISKRADGRYVQTRSPDWLKTKCTKRQEFVVGGFTEPSGARLHFGALLLGYYDDGKLQYAGRVGTGFTSQSLRDVYRDLKKIRAKAPPFAGRLAASDRRGVTWVEPTLVAEVEFTEWTDDGQLRHPSFQGLREDKPATKITRETPTMPRLALASTNGRKSTPSRLTSAKAAGDAVVAGVTITHPDRVLYPGQGVTKRSLAEFYVGIADYIMPYIENRPLTLVRCPGGQAKACFYQKHITGDMPPGLRGVMVEENGGADEYVVVDDVSGLVGLVQMGVLELHPWPARADNLERPDMLVFDLDPGEGVVWKDIVRAAGEVRDLLESLNLRSFLRTSGGKGLHVVAPLARRNDWNQFKVFAKGVADAMVRTAPDRYIATLSKAKRRGKIFVDYLRNQRGATAVASYSTRARPGATVATPLAWSELAVKLKPDKFTVLNLPKRLQTLREDPWGDFFTVKQSITREMERRLQ